MRIGIRLAISGLVLASILVSAVGVHLLWWRTAEANSHALADTINRQIVAAVEKEVTVITTEARAAHEPIVLWFESDLYDVLQLAQIAGRIDHGDDVRAVLVGTTAFRGVAELSPEEIRATRPVPFDPAPFKALWHAFTAPDPRGLATLGDTTPLVRDAAARLLEELPWTTDGLGRSERALRDAPSNGARSRAEAFAIAQRQEERPFLGDAVAFDYLEHPARERWLGGTPVGAWRYDPATRTAVG